MSDRFDHKLEHKLETRLAEDDAGPGSVRWIEVITGTGHRRRWSSDDQVRIVVESLEPGANAYANVQYADLYCSRPDVLGRAYSLFTTHWEISMSLFLWMGLGAAQKAAGSDGVTPSDRRRDQTVSIVIGILLAVLIGVGLFVLINPPI